MLVVHDPRCAEYGSIPHPEKPARVVETARHLRRVHPEWEWLTPVGEADDQALLLAHTPEHLARLEVPVDFDPDTATYPSIAAHARRGVQAALMASGHAVAGKGPVFSLMRPPGHHATRDQAMGFCYLNHAAIAALHARVHHGLQKVAVWDFDAHHGNGTQDILEGREGFLYCSVHQSPCYPGTGLEDRANCRNWPVAPGTPRAEHRSALRASFEAVVSFGPELVIVSAGFDAYVNDPITDMTLEAEDFAELGQWMRSLQVPSFAILEGGYSPDLPFLVDAFLSAWGQPQSEHALF